MEFNGKYRKNDSKQLVSSVAYLIGVRESAFSEDLFLRSEFDRLDAIPEANKIRDLCMLRTALVRKGKEIDAEMLYFKPIDKLPESLVPQKAITRLRNYGIEIVKANRRVIGYTSDVNALIEENIGCCRNLFPVWIEWRYIRNLFIMPKGNTDQGVNSARSFYQQNADFFPFHCYLNIPRHESGNILHTDRKFVSLLYRFNGDTFEDTKMVMDVTADERDNLTTFMSAHKNICVVVDCENSNPYLLCDALNNIKAHHPDISESIKKVILFDDNNTVDAWRWISGYLKFPTEHVLVERINEHKSLVDQRITARVQQEYYENSMTGFLLVSSDSDYWGLIAYSKADFLVLAEREKTGSCFTDALKDAKVNYSFLEDFASTDSKFKEGALAEMVNNYLSERISLDINEMFNHIFSGSRMPVTAKEQNMMVEKMLKKLHLNIGKSGELSVVCG